MNFEEKVDDFIKKMVKVRVSKTMEHSIIKNNEGKFVARDLPLTSNIWDRKQVMFFDISDVSSVIGLTMPDAKQYATCVVKKWEENEVVFPLTGDEETSGNDMKECKSFSSSKYGGLEREILVLDLNR